jgi:NADPH-dependent ferric siderophore reductase
VTETDALLVKAIREAGETLPEDIRQAVLARGEAAKPALRELADEGTEASVHALRLLIEIADRVILDTHGQILDKLIEEAPLAGPDAYEDLYDEAMESVQALGMQAVDVLARAYADPARAGSRWLVAAVAGGSRIEDERLLSLLLDYLGHEPEHAAMCLAEYGDARALPALSAVLDAAPVQEAGFAANHVFVELAAAIRDLGGDLSPQQRAKCEHARRISRDMGERLTRIASPEAPPPRPGRNDPCWCGSGRKYKRCHLDTDERQLRA